MSDTARFSTWVLIITVMVVAFGAGIWISMNQETHGNAAAVDGLLWPDPPMVPSFNLIDHHGRPFTAEQLNGRWSLLFFGFTHCPDVCPTSLDAMAKAHVALQSNADYAAHGQVIFISVDPARDTSQILADYVGHFSSDFVGVSGGEAELTALARALGVLFVKVEQGDTYTMDHSAGVFLVGPHLQLLSVLTPPYDASQITNRFEAINRFIRARS